MVGPLAAKFGCTFGGTPAVPEVSGERLSQLRAATICWQAPSAEKWG